jgi:hypothetical protein
MQSMFCFYAVSFQSVNSKACGSKVAKPLFIFLIDEVVKHFYKIKPWACNAVATAASL